MKKKEVVIFETKHWKVVLIPEQLYLGRSVVVLKRPCGDLANLRRDEWLELHGLIRKLEALFRKAFGAEMFNWSCLMNDAYQDIPPKPQVHWHFRPRYRHPVELGGNTFKDPNFGHHALHGDGDKMFVTDEVLQMINERLQECL